MLGDQIGEETGTVLVIRVLDSAPLKAEVSIHTKGKLLGNDYQGRATYTSTMQAGGFLYGEGHGVRDCERRHGELDRPGNRKDEARRWRKLSRRASFPERYRKAGETGWDGGRIRARD